MYPHGFGFLLMPIMWLLPVSIYNERFIFLLNLVFVGIFCWVWVCLIKSAFKLRFRYWQAILTLIIIFGTYWTQYFALTGDISPRMLGLSLLLVFLHHYFFKEDNGKNRIKLALLAVAIFIIHSPELIYLFVPLVLYELIYKYKTIFKQFWKMPFFLFALVILVRFLVQVSGLHNFHPYLTSYDFKNYHLIEIVNYYGFLPLVLAFIGMHVVFKRRNQKEQRIDLYMAVSFLFCLIILQLGDQWARSTELIWANYRNWVYGSIPIAYLNIEAIMHIKNKLRFSRLVLIIYFFIVGVTFLFQALKICLIRVIDPSDMLNFTPKDIKKMLIVGIKDQSMLRKHTRLYEKIRQEIPFGSNIYIGTANWDYALMGGAILQKNNLIWYAEYPEIPFVFFNRSIASSSAETKKVWEILAEKKVNWLILDTMWKNKLNPGSGWLEYTQINYWEYVETKSDYQPARTYVYRKV